MTEPVTLEALHTALKVIREALSSLTASVKKNEDAIESIEFPESPSHSEFSSLKTDFEKVREKVKENFGLLENSLRDAFSQIEKNAQSIQTCIDEIRVVGGSDRNLRRPANVSTSVSFTLLEL